MDYRTGEFIAKIAAILEVEAQEISLATDFRRDIAFWDSMKGFAIIVMLQDDYATEIEVTDFLNYRTVAELWQKTGADSHLS